jgi:HD-GYP domain-containing protein (c-di-GMP phosphodiesterase class II)
MDRINFRLDRKGEGLHLLTRNVPLTSKIKRIHASIRRRFDFVDRLAVALHDPDCDYLKTFVSSQDAKNPLEQYRFPLKEAHSLMEAIVKGPRVVNDLSIFSEGLKPHTKRILKHGYKASYAAPILFDDTFLGFTFINSHTPGCFTEKVLEDLDLYCHIIGSTVAQWTGNIKILKNSLNIIVEILQVQRPEEQAQMQRVSQLSRLIAEEMVRSKKLSYDEETLEQLQQFSALHDVGMVAVLDSIVQKSGSLDENEFALMTKHTEKGLQMIDSIISHFGLQSMPGVEMLRNIVFYHHERMNGTGYPSRLRGKKIPIEARILAVADVYEALTHDRPYRPQYSKDIAFDRMMNESRKFDADCLAALERCRI